MLWKLNVGADIIHPLERWELMHHNYLHGTSLERCSHSGGQGIRLVDMPKVYSRVHKSPHRVGNMLEVTVKDCWFQLDTETEKLPLIGFQLVYIYWSAIPEERLHYQTSTCALWKCFKANLNEICGFKDGENSVCVLLGNDAE